MTGWTGGDNGDIYKTTNGGMNFYFQTIPNPGGFFTDICFLNDTVGWATKVQRIYNTTDGGGEFVGVFTSSNELPLAYNLKQNYPNPFNPNTMIEFEIKKEDDVLLTVYDILGRDVQNLVDKKLPAGKYSTQFNGNKLSSGIYFYTLYYSGGKITKKMILNK